MSCPYCGATGDCPHWEPKYNVWSKDGKGSYMESVLYWAKHPWLSPSYDPNWEEKFEGLVISGSVIVKVMNCKEDKND